MILFRKKGSALIDFSLLKKCHRLQSKACTIEIYTMIELLNVTTGSTEPSAFIDDVAVVAAADGDCDDDDVNDDDVDDNDNNIDGVLEFIFFGQTVTLEK